MKYDVVNANSLSLLIKNVNELIEKGWEPQGGISATSVLIEYTLHYTYSQAMIKRN